MINVRGKILLNGIAVIASALLIGCGGGSSSNPPADDPIVIDPVDDPIVTPPTFKGVASISGTLGSSGKDGIASLKLDIDGDGKYDGKEDTRLSVESKDGSFTFAKIDTLNGKQLKGQLIVSVDGYAPYQQVVTISDGDTLAIDASGAISKPALKEVVSLASLSPSARMGSIIEFGINNSGGELQSFSRLISLSQLKAEADLPIEDGRVSSYTFATASIPPEVTTVEATMQAFDSTKSEDMKNFPGTFTGYGLDGSKSATGDEVGLESAAFDLLVLKDQNGEEIKLLASTSKLTQKVDLSTCTNKWTRNISSAQASVIEGWGDYDSNDDGFQVPIWSNDNSENAWKFIGVANYIQSSSKFEMCIPDDWGSGYLNCDSPITFSKPTLMCINTLDQTNNPLSGVSVNGRTTSGQYGYGYTNNDGHTSISITDNDISKWSFTYSGALTGWNYIDVNLTANPILEVNSAECTYELNITNITNIYTHDIKVTAKNIDGSIASNAYVSLYHNGYGSHYYSKGAYTDANGEAIFKVEIGVSYKASYGAGSADVKIDGNVVSPETADNNNYADVTVQDVNVAPTGYIYLSRNTINKEITTSMSISISGYDRNPDTLSLTSLKIDGVDVTIDNPNESISPYYYYNSGSINISSLSVATHTVTAVISDGTDSVTLTKTFEVKGNLPPVISTPISAISNGTVFYIEKSGTTIKPNIYTFSANVYDPDGDSFTSTITLDSVEVNATEQNLTIGEHTIVITAKDSKNNTSTETINFTVANLKPIISQAAITPNPINISVSSDMTIYAYVTDPDGDNIASVIATDKVTNTTYTLSNGGSGAYYSVVIDANTIGEVEGRVFGVVATDDASNALSSDEKNISITIRNFNAIPTIETPLYNQSVAVGTTVTLSVTALDPEKTRLSFVWKVDGVINNSARAGTTLSAIGASNGASQEELVLSGLSDGEHNISCTVTDADGASATTTATLNVFDPTQEHPLTIDTTIPNLTVTLHDSSNNFKMIDSKITDANGDALFNVTGLTASFSLAFDPSITLSESEVYEIILENVVSDARNHCNSYYPTTTECSTADWCALSTANTIPVWLFNEANVTNNNITITGESIDTDSDGKVSSSEVYVALLSTKDLNSDGKISLAEVDDTGVYILAYADVPVRKYTFDLGTPNSHYNYHCDNDDNTFDINLSNASNISNINVTGSGSGYGYNYNANLDIGVEVSVYNGDYNIDSDGKYDFLIDIVDVNSSKHYIELLLDKSESDLANDTYTYNASALIPATYRDVNITEDVANVNMYINSIYKGVNFSNYNYINRDGNSTLYRYYYNSSLDYIVSSYQYIGNIYYGQNNYDNDRGLNSSYRTSDYPMLNVDITIDYNNTKVSFSGSDVGLIDYSVVGLSGNKIGSYYDYNSLFSISIYSFANPTREFNFVDINLSQAFPANISDQIDTDRNDTYITINASATEFKNKTAIEMVDSMMSEYNNGTEPTRLVSHYNDMHGIYYKIAPSRKVVGKDIDRPKPTNIANPFDLKINMKKLFN